MLDDMKDWSFGEWCLFIAAIIIVLMVFGTSIYATIEFRMFA